MKKMRTSITAKAMSFSVVIVAFLTLLSHLTGAGAFFFLLYPGAALSLLITGGHGGTETESIIAFVISFVVNTIAYALLCAALLAIRSRDKGSL